MRRIVVASVVVVAGVVAAIATTGRPLAAAGQDRHVFPGAEWARVEPGSVSAACRTGLDKATAAAKGMATTGAIAIQGGRVLWEHGDLALVSYLASVRKSILAMMYGKY
ncbi:MAG TPA: hypothetical protein VFO19_23665, partial [Vicinamibacterales bacterium]|nr:hypothetical protein [Vicinamibacterales bacterium]